MTWNPYSPIEAEAARSLVGCALVYPESLPLVSLPEEALFDPNLRALLRCAREVYESGYSGDPAEFALRVAELARVPAGDLPLANAAIPSGIGGYEEIVAEGHVTRQTVEALDDSLRRVKAGTEGTEGLSHSLARLQNIAVGAKSKCETVVGVVRSRIEQINQVITDRSQGIDTPLGLPTGLTKLDDIGGYELGVPSLIIGRPGHGKSSLATAAEIANVARGWHVLTFSVEEGRAQRADRYISLHSGVPVRKLRAANLTFDERVRAGRVATEIPPNWLINAEAGLTAGECVAEARKVMARVGGPEKPTGLRLVVVDLVGRLRPSKKASADQYERMLMVESLKTFSVAAKQDGVAYLLVAQVNREVEKRNPPRGAAEDDYWDCRQPRAHDVYGSDVAAQDMKFIISVQRPCRYFQNYAEDDMRVAVVKNNQGEEMAFRAHFTPELTKVNDYGAPF